MYDRETVELALMALEEGMTRAEAAELAGAARRTVGRWAAGRLPRSYTGRPWGSGKMGGASGERKAARMSTGGAVRPAGDRAPRGAGAGSDREPAAQGGVGRPKSGRVGPGFDLEQEQVRARREIEAGDRPAPPLDHRFLEDIEELL